MSVNTVLIVDDSSTYRTQLELIINTAGCQVLCADSGRKALEIAEKEQPDLIFLDIIMDDMDGFQACRTLNQEQKTRDIPVIMVSSKKNKADMVWAKEQGAKGYVVKPYTEDQILEQLRRF